MRGHAVVFADIRLDSAGYLRSFEKEYTPKNKNSAKLYPLDVALNDS